MEHQECLINFVVLILTNFCMNLLLVIYLLIFKREILKEHFDSMKEFARKMRDKNKEDEVKATLSKMNILFAISISWMFYLALLTK